MQKGFSYVVREAQNAIPHIERFGESVAEIVAEFIALSGKTNAIANLRSIFESIGSSAQSILRIASAIVQLVDGTKNLNNEMTAFQTAAKLLDMIFQGWAIIFNGISSVLAASADYISPSTTPGGTVRETGGIGIIDEAKGMFAYGLRSLLGTENMQPANTNTGQPPKLTLVPPPSTAPRVSLNVPPAPLTGTAEVAAPKVPLQVVKPSGGNQVTVNQNLNFQHEGKEAFRTANDVGAAAKNAVNQMKVNQVN